MRQAFRHTLAIVMLIALGCERHTALAGELMPCDGDEGRHLPFRALDVGIGEPPLAPYATGTARREVVTDSAQWRSVWSSVAPSLPLPHVAFRDSIVLLVATRVYASGPRTVRIVDVQRCASGAVVVMTQTERRNTPLLDADRTIAAVAMHRALIRAATVQFIELPDHMRE